MNRVPMAVLLLAALPVAAAGSHGPPGRELAPEDEKAIHDYRLSTSNVDKLLEAGKRIRVLAEKDPSMQDHNPMQAKTLDDSVKRMQQHPGVVGALKGAGVTPREFVVGTFAMMTSAMWSAMRKSYPQAQPPGYVNPENMKFIDDHPEVMRKWQEAWRDASHRHGAPGGEGEAH